MTEIGVDDLFGDEPVIPAADLGADPIIPEGEIPTGGGLPTDTSTQTNTADLVKPIDAFLAEYGIEGGMIQFENGDRVHFDDLDDESKVEILRDLNKAERLEAEENLALNEDELNFINAVRNNKLSISDALEVMVQSRLKSELLSKEVQGINFADMSDEAIFITNLTQNNPNLTDEEIDAELALAMKSKTFPSTIKLLRDSYISTQTLEANKAKDADRIKQEAALEADRRKIVTAAQGIEDIAGFVINKDTKNFILEQLLEVNADNDPKFMEEIFSDPEKLFRAAFWYHYGEDTMKSANAYWKAENAKTYARAKQDALGKSSQPISFASTKKAQQQSPANKESDWDELHNK